MAKTESPERQLNYLQQCLSSNKRPIGLFFGAGCPMAISSEADPQTPLIPDIEGITRLIHEELGNSEDCGPLLRSVDEHLRDDGLESPTLEDMLAYVRALRAVAGNTEVRGFHAGQLDRLDKAICDHIHQVVDKSLPHRESPYHRVASWVGAVRRDHPVAVFTTNYDLLMEQAFEEVRVPYFDGFAGVRRPFFDVRAMEEDLLPPRWARLWKLHGSINWYQAPGTPVFRGTTIEGEVAKRVIHPSHLKYDESRRMPYLAMIDRLRAFLKHPASTLVLCGYSFRRDDHINEVIVQGLQSTQTAVAFALMYGELRESPQATALARVHPNLLVLARDGAIISGQEVGWLETGGESLPAKSTPGLRWKKVGDEAQDDAFTAKLTLGDFAAFGSFLDGIVGGPHLHEEASSGG